MSHKQNMKDPIAVDIIIPTRNRSQLIDLVIQSIRESEHTHFNVYVIDQSEDDRTKIAVSTHQEEDDRIHYCHSQDKGSSRARNLGIALGSAPIVLFTDDDCRVAPDWITEMVSAITEGANPHWAVFSRVEHDAEFLDPALLPADEQVHPSLKLASKTSRTPHVYASNRFHLNFGHGAGMGFRREILTRLGGFDDLLSNGAELRSWPEKDIGYRILIAGGSIIYNPAALVYHRHWRTWDSIVRSFKNYGFGTGAAVGKYIRCGDWQAIYILAEWFFDQGVRAVLSGIFKWQSRQKITAGLIQMVYPWLGLIYSLRYRVNHEDHLYLPPIGTTNPFDVEPTTPNQPIKSTR